MDRILVGILAAELGIDKGNLLKRCKRDGVALQKVLVQTDGGIQLMQAMDKKDAETIRFMYREARKNRELLQP